ncbi:hypothetical protein ACA910_014602 [Epithemia clementina (nom. ined.)]
MGCKPSTPAVNVAMMQEGPPSKSMAAGQQKHHANKQQVAGATLQQAQLTTPTKSQQQPPQHAHDNSNSRAGVPLTDKPNSGVAPVNTNSNHPMPSGSQMSSPGSTERSAASVYNMLLQARAGEEVLDDMANQILAVCGSMPMTAQYQHPQTKMTPLHLAIQLLDEDPVALAMCGTDLLSVIEGLVQAYPDAVQMEDKKGNIPLHYAISPIHIPTTTNTHSTSTTARDEAESWGPRSAVLQLLLTTDMETSMEYLVRNDVVYNEKDKSGGVTPLYRAIQALPDDFEPFSVTYEFISILRDACGEMVGVGNKGDGDKPLALLYRRFTRQFDLAEKFFEGDNSRQEVVDHRFRYKTAAANTWKIIECLLRPDASPNTSATNSPLRQHTKKSASNNIHEWRLVHRAVQVETPPDLLRYIVETNAEDLTKPDNDGNLPLHYAARSKPSDRASETAFPSFYTKYVVDELLYKFPEAASMTDANGKYPLTLAVEAGKQWIGGGIKSLYDAFPGALEQINLDEHETLRRVITDESYFGEEKISDSVIRDEHHDAVMMVQREDVEISEVVTSMWAHEEDAGVQMLSCVAVTRIVEERAQNNHEYLLRIALSAVAAVVNAMKAHPNEVIVQEKACQALKSMAKTDEQQEISFVASGAVAAVVGAMQAHVSDPSVQEEACGAITEIIRAGGCDRATIVASVSGFTAIVNALAAHPDHVGVQRNACLALDAMTSYGDDANLPELARTQTEPLLEAARQKFPSECGPAADAVMARLVE